MPDRQDGAVAGEPIDGLIVIAASVADAVPAPVEGGERNDEGGRIEGGQVVARFAETEGTRNQRLTGAPFAEDEALRRHLRQGDSLAAREQHPDER